MSTPRLGLAIALLALLPVMSRVDALAALAIITALPWAVIAYEAITLSEFRRQIRSAHGHGTGHSEP